MADPSRPATAATRPGIGAREVLGVSLSGGERTADVRALLLGTRIDTRNLRQFVEPETLTLSGIGAAYVFRYGVLVLFGASSEIEAELIARLSDHVIEPVSSPEIETAWIEIRPGGEELVSADGHIRLREATPERLLLTATVLARSVVLARDESRIAEAFDRIEPLVNELRTQGRAGLPIRRVMQHIGDVLSTQHRVVGRAQIGEKPDLLWDHPELDRLYGRLEAEFELGDRARAIERKLEVIGDAADVLLDLVQDKRSYRLEIAVILLIAFEVVLNLFEFWRH
ncbi:RMD1 family protein [Sphingomonas sp. PR090111-T3T-6A]|uniref:RMD1 family protein n=1 Tax=Sphingomonas sp. PR090111-T3T-6A TaxID=685778 RepID=UPI000381C892|nr:RMD1 family protein [Sphingomonas sp. PR090111-T3T-6A]